MIEKIISIKNIGRFHNCGAPRDVSFQRLTLLFGENGRGKTTLCAILRSLQTGDVKYISQRQTLGSTDLPQVTIRLGGNNFTYGANGWSSTYPNIAIFDSEFINQNIYSGDHVDHEHKKNLHRVIIGALGVQLAQKVEELDGKIRQANQDISLKSAAVSKTLPTRTALETYINWEPTEDIDAKLQQKKDEIANKELTLKKNTEIQSKEILTKISLPSLTSDFEKILSKEVNNVIDDAESRISRQIDVHCMEEEGEIWLSQGVEYISDDKCPFCGQRIDANELINAYRSHFNDAYQELKQEVAGLPQQILDSIGEIPLNTLQQIHSSNLTLIEFWKQFDQISAPNFDFEDLIVKYKDIRTLALDLAQRKQQSPSEPISPEADFQLSLQALDSLQTVVDTYNASVDDINTIIKRIKDDAQQVSDIDVLKSELAELEANKKRFEPEVIQTVKEYQEAVNAKISLEKEKEISKKQLDEHCRDIFPSCELSINKYLDQFNAGFRITNSRHMYTGGSPSSHYQIEINSNTVEVGDTGRQSEIPQFKTALSSGDRSALALAFFLATLEYNPEISKTIVVLDDPFTSLDRFRRTCTQQLICQFANSAHQVIVLSHDPHFLKLIWDNYPQDNKKALQLSYQSTENTTIGNCDIEAETQSTYQMNYSTLLHYYRERKGGPLNVARTIRPFLEGMLRSRFPGHFFPNDWLGDYIKKIREAQSTDGLSQAHNILSEIEAINGYSKKYHHDQNPNADSEVLSEDELHGFVKRTLRLVGGC